MNRPPIHQGYLSFVHRFPFYIAEGGKSYLKAGETAKQPWAEESNLSP